MVVWLVVCSVASLVVLKAVEMDAWTAEHWVVDWAGSLAALTAVPWVAEKDASMVVLRNEKGCLKKRKKR